MVILRNLGCLSSDTVPLSISLIIDMTVYFERNISGAISHKVDELIVIKHRVDGTQLLIYIYTYVHVYTFIAVR